MDLVRQFTQRSERALPFERERLVLQLVQALDFFDGRGDDGLGFLISPLLELLHGSGAGVDAQDVGPPFLQKFLVLFPPGVFVDKIKHSQVSSSVADRARPIAQLEKPNIPQIIKCAFIEQLGAVAWGQIKLLLFSRDFGLLESRQMVFQD